MITQESGIFEGQGGHGSTSVTWQVAWHRSEKTKKGGGILVDKKCVFSPVDLAVIKKLAVFFLAFPITVRCVISGSSICAVRKKNHCYCLDGFQETLPRLFIGFQKGCTKLLWRK